MKITELIGSLEDRLKEGYNHVATDAFGLTSWIVSKDEVKGLGVGCYILIFSESYYKDEPVNPLEGKHYKRIESSITDVYFEVDSGGMLHCLFRANPIDKLPKWYNKDYIMDDFEDIDISDIEMIEHL